MRVLDLFSGIGGFSLGLERAGMKTAMFCEIEPYCRRVLAKHWPGVPIHDDVRTLDRLVVAEKAGAIDLVCGGFPCQDISVAGKGAGITGERSGLWFEYRRIVEEVRPRWVIIENVPALRSRGLEVVLGGLAALGYDAEWHCIPASALGAPHRRDRVWIVAHTRCGSLRAHGVYREERSAPRGAESEGGERQWVWNTAGRGGSDVADANGAEPPDRDGEPLRPRAATINAERCGGGRRGPDVAPANSSHVEGQWSLTKRVGAQLGDAGDGGWWRSEPDVGRVAHGVPARVDRLRSLGNAVVPQIPEMIGRAIMASEERASDA